MVNIITERARNFEVLLNVANGDRSFEEVTVSAGGAEILAGSILGFDGTSYVPYDEGASDGSEVVAGVLLITVEADTGAADVERAVIKRDATVKKHKLEYTGTESTVVAGLSALNIIAR